jgi:hypothetical protein
VTDVNYIGKCASCLHYDPILPIRPRHRRGRCDVHNDIRIFSRHACVKYEVDFGRIDEDGRLV